MEKKKKRREKKVRQLTRGMKQIYQKSSQPVSLLFLYGGGRNNGFGPRILAFLFLLVEEGQKITVMAESRRRSGGGVYERVIPYRHTYHL